jgi:hypothetical protein
MRWLPHAIAAGVTLPFAVWIATSDFRGVLQPAAWLMPLAGAYYLGFRIGREILRGVLRARSDEEPRSNWSTTNDENEYGENR